MPDTALARAAGAADAMRVDVRLLGRIEVDHVRDVVDIESACGHVGRDEGLDPARVEVRECLFALRLPLVAVNRDRVDVVAAQLLDEAVGARLGADEHEHEPALGVVEQFDERRDLGLVRHRDEAVVDVAAATVGRQLALEARREVGVATGELADLAVERRGEEHRLAVLPQLAHEAVDLRLEAHVEHPVGLVEHEHAHRVERDEVAVDEILQPAGRRDDHVRGFRLVRLRLERHPAVHRRDLDLVAGDQRELLGHLHAELTRRDEHERRGARLGRVEALEDRDRERERLAGSGRALGQDVAAAQRLRDHERLDLERGFDAARGQQPAHGLGHPEGTEICHLSQLLRTSRSCVRRRRRDLTGTRPIRVP